MSKDDPDKPRCTGRTASGRPCKQPPVPGTTRCWHHSYKVPGRKSKLTPELRDRILDAVLEGNYIETAAQIAGVNKTTLYRWLRRAEDVEAQALELVVEDGADFYEHVDPAEWVYLDFRHALKSAEAYSEAELLRMSKSAAVAGSSWQAFMTILERRHPDRWGRRKVLDHTIRGELESRSRVELIVPTDGQRAGAVAGILASAGALDDDDEEDLEDGSSD